MTTLRTPTNTFGRQVECSKWSPERDVIGKPELSPSGNLVLRCGTENEDHESWSQVLHVVMKPEEAADFIAACQALLALKRPARTIEPCIDRSGRRI